MSGKATAFVAFFTAFACHKIEKTYISTPFQSGSALVHTPRTRRPKDAVLGPRVAFSGSLWDGRIGAADALANPVSPLGFLGKRAQWLIAGWSSPVARQAHNLKVASSNLAPATKTTVTDPAIPGLLGPCLRKAS